MTSSTIFKAHAPCPLDGTCLSAAFMPDSWYISKMGRPACWPPDGVRGWLSHPASSCICVLHPWRTHVFSSSSYTCILKNPRIYANSITSWFLSLADPQSSPLHLSLLHLRCTTATSSSFNQVRPSFGRSLSILTKLQQPQHIECNTLLWSLPFLGDSGPCFSSY